jgi:nucleotide-binding universal stress UspA family protein
MAERILCVVSPSLADASLVRGCTLARSTSAELLVATMSGGALRVTSLSGAFGDSEFVGMLGDGLDDDTPVPTTRLVVDHLIAEATRVASEHAVGMVVVPTILGPRAVALTERLQVPVLVARPTRGASVLIAVAMAAGDELLLAAGHQLAARSGASLVAVHNRAPVPDAEPDADRLRERLAETARLFAPIRCVVTRGPCAVQGVLGAARAEAADVIVVGVGARSWLRRELDGGIPERFAREGGRSVLMVPARRYEA